MKLSFLGAAQTVTGSCHLLEVNNQKILVDCGLFQGSKLVTSFNQRPFLFNPGEIDAVLLTHAHIDHCGLLPRLVAEGFRGPIYATKVTYELCSILLPDSAHIQEVDSQNTNRRRKRQGREEIKPLYNVDQAYDALQYFKLQNFGEEFSVGEGVKVVPRRAGHIMGAAMFEVYIDEDGTQTKLLFTGDIGQPEQPIIRDPDIIDSADYVVIESTYGDRVHGTVDVESILSKVINDTVERGGNVIIPAFAVGRTQVLLYYLQKLYHENKIPNIPIVIDSPLASKATDIILRNPQEFDDESKELYEKYTKKLMDLPQLRFTQSVDESRALNESPGSKIIISASGMADAGRVVHHLKHNLWRPEASVLFVGYQSPGSMGRALLEGANKVKIFGEVVKVKASIYNMETFSAHADKVQMLDWLKKMTQKPKGFFIVHGEFASSYAFSQEIHRQLGSNTYIPAYGDIATVDAQGWHVQEAESISAVPAISELRSELKTVAKRYLDYKMRMERLLADDPTKLAEIRRKISKISKFMDNVFDEL